MARPRQGRQHREIPEQDLEQERLVADHLDIDFGNFRDQPVLRKPRDTDEKSEHGGEHDAEAGNEKRVEQADDEGTAIGRGLAIGDQRLRNAKTGGPVQEAEAGRDPLRRKVSARVLDEIPAETDDKDEEGRLYQDRTGARIGEKRTSLPWRALDDIDHSTGLLGSGAPPVFKEDGRRLSLQRIGGAYCKPPFDHSLLRPRSILSGESAPTLRSNTSP